MSEVTFKYEQVKLLQDELGKRILRSCHIIESKAATYNEFVTMFNEHRSRGLSSLKRVLVWFLVGLLSIAVRYSDLFTPDSVAKLVLLIVQSVAHLNVTADWFKQEFSKKEREEGTKRMQLLHELQQKSGQFKEALYLYKKQFDPFMQQLGYIVEFCHEHPNELIVLRECGQVSTQQVLQTLVRSCQDWTTLPAQP